ncbi:MAG: Ribosomal RNA small subunit methyltransferase B [Syntrophomonadaceae bacterium]|nr:Ribosomal RNA small subunit methyltransferase B [Bacillota bacterium]
MDMRRKRNAREASLLALQRVEEDGAFVNLALAEVLAAAPMDQRDKGLATEITYGVITHRLTLDWMISQAAARPVEKIDASLLQILRIGFYQLFYLTRIPASAAVHATVELAKRGKKKALAPFVNGVLRGALRNRASLPWPERSADEPAYLALRYAHPQWLVERWLVKYGSQETEELLEANNRPAPQTARVNTLRMTREDLLTSLAAEGVEAAASLAAPEGVIFKTGGRLTALAAYRQGLFQVQGESAMFAAKILAPLPGEDVLDCCSAPGGKTTHLAQLMENQGKILALDIYPHRLALVEANCRRLGVDIVRTVCLDARGIDPVELGFFDRILLDVPCSGLGVLRRKPDLKWRFEEKDIFELAQLQKELVQAALSVLKPGGVLLYCTCTNEPEETEEVVAQTLAYNRELSLAEFASSLPPQWQTGVGKFGVHLLSHRHHLDGFFFSLLKKR